MNGLIIGLYGLFLLGVGFSGNAGRLSTEVKKDFPDFIVWAVGIAVLAVMTEYPTTERIARPFIILLILNYILSNFENLKEEYNKLLNIRK